MRFALLGPVRFCSRDGESEPAAEVRGTMPRTILTALLLDANTVVSVDRLVELLWAGDPPASAQASLHNHIARLRRLLGDRAAARLVSMPPGYLFRVEPGELDLEEFTTLCARGAAALRAGEWNDASNLLAEARTLWRGEPAADVPALDRTDARIQQLVENVAEAAVGWAEAELALGRHRELIPELRGLTIRYPLREELYGHLMLALYRSERQAEALEVYQQLRRTLVDELSLEPSTPLRLLHQRILARDSALAAPASGERPRVGGHGARFNLPPDTAAFTGRERELAELYAFEDAARRLGSGAAAVVAIDGMAGIGKTALALHAAHRMAERFPDGRMFLDLRGHSPGL
ncbi:MAG TPA: BTAD domain-containing putative transcriptional regulator, partial [Actinospica sp.]|nr:BTAD domain-containing putative transcriptional regulator [Actinospica sp.]